MPHYYKKMIYAWFEFKESIDINTERNFKCVDIMNEDLWFNSNIKDHDGKVLFFKQYDNIVFFSKHALIPIHVGIFPPLICTGSRFENSHHSGWL